MYFTDDYDVAAELAGRNGNCAKVWEFAQLFAEAQSKPILARDSVAAKRMEQAEQRLEVKLPAAMSEAYSIFGENLLVSTGPCPLMSPEELHLDENYLVFRENEKERVKWGCSVNDLGEADPSVLIKIEGTWQPYLENFSTVCVEMLLTGALMSFQGIMVCCELPNVRSYVADHFERIELPDYRNWISSAASPIRWFSSKRYLIRVDGSDAAIIVSRTEQDMDDSETVFPDGEITIGLYGSLEQWYPRSV